MKENLFILVLAAALCDVIGETCTINGRGVGYCKSINECPEMIKIYKSYSTAPDNLKSTFDFELRQRTCNYGFNDWSVCCDECKTPDGKAGTIKHIQDCPDNNIRVNAEEPYVCCPTPMDNRIGRENNCDSQIAFPPDPSTKCCGIHLHAADKITGGNTTDIYQYPWTVMLEYDTDGGKIITCCGSLISNRIVVTAAHCIAAGNLKSVRVGEHNLEQEGPDCSIFDDGSRDCNAGAMSYSIEAVVKHPQYKNQMLGTYYKKHNDIGLIRLKEPVPYTDFVRPICLPSYDNTKLSEYIVTGWGRTKDNKTVRSSLKQHVRLPLMDQQDCQAVFDVLMDSQSESPIWEKQICAGGDNDRDSCDGDSGGPLMSETSSAHYELAGVVSFGWTSCGTRGVPGVYTAVYHYLSWINEKLRDETNWEMVQNT